MFVVQKIYRDEVINFKVTKKQKQIIKQMANQRGMTITAMILTLIQKEYESPEIGRNYNENRY